MASIAAETVAVWDTEEETRIRELDAAVWIHEMPAHGNLVGKYELTATTRTHESAGSDVAMAESEAPVRQPGSTGR